MSVCNNFNLEEEILKIKPLMGEEEWDSLRITSKMYVMLAEGKGETGKIDFLFLCICGTYKNPRLHSYLAEFLKSFDSETLNKNPLNLSYTSLYIIMTNLDSISIDCFRMLFKAGINVNMVDENGAISLRLLEEYYQCREDYESKPKCEELSDKEIHNHIEQIIKLFVEYGVNLNHRDFEGRTILQIFSQRQINDFDKAIITCFLDNGALYEPTKDSTDEFNAFIRNYTDAKS